MGTETLRSLRYFILGFQNAFTPDMEELNFRKPGYYMKSVSKKRREKLVTYEKSRDRQESRRDKSIRSSSNS